MSDRVNRRTFLSGAAAATVAGAASAPSAFGRGRPDHGHGHGHEPEPPRGLPRRGEFTIRGAYVLSMDAGIGDVAGGDVHVRDGRIVAVGKRLRGGGEQIDGRSTIVSPGLIDTHWHTWTTLYRSMATAGGATANGYFALNLRHGAVIQPGDIAAGARLSLADALSSGITFVHDWSHNIRSPAYADANLKAWAELGLRGRFSYGAPQGHPATATIDLADVGRVQRDWIRSGRAGGLVSLGIAGRPPGTVGPDVYRAEWARARELGLPISYHANSNRAQGAQQMVQKLGDEGYLGPNTQIIHALYLTEAERQLLVATKTPVSVSPWSELLIGYGVTPIRQMVKDGMLLNLSVDTTPLTGTGEMFSVMRLALGLDRGQAEAEFDLTARRVLEMATIDAARGMGVADVVGSLTPGKRADLMMVRTDDLNVAPFTDAPNLLTLAAGPQNVDTVVVDGRILKRRGALVHVDPRRIVSEAQTALAGVLARAGTPAVAAARRRPHDDVACCG